MSLRCTRQSHDYVYGASRLASMNAWKLLLEDLQEAAVHLRRRLAEISFVESTERNAEI